MLEGMSRDHLVHLQQVAQDHVQRAFEYLQGGSLHNLSGQPAPVCNHPHINKHFLMLSQVRLYFNMALVLSLNTTKKSLA